MLTHQFPPNVTTITQSGQICGQKFLCYCDEVVKKCVIVVTKIVATIFCGGWPQIWWVCGNSNFKESHTSIYNNLKSIVSHTWKQRFDNGYNKISSLKDFQWNLKQSKRGKTWKSGKALKQKEFNEIIDLTMIKGWNSWYSMFIKW